MCPHQYLIYMAESAIQTYIHHQRTTGVSDSAITSALLAQGWDMTDITAALSTVHTPAAAAVKPTKQIRIVSLLLGLLSVSEFFTGFAVLFTIYTLNAALSKNGQSPPYEFIRSFSTLLIKAVSSVVSGIMYLYLSMRVMSMDKALVRLVITVMLAIFIVETITGTVTAIQMNAILQATKIGI